MPDYGTFIIIEVTGIKDLSLTSGLCCDVDQNPFVGCRLLLVIGHYSDLNDSKKSRVRLREDRPESRAKRVGYGERVEVGLKESKTERVGREKWVRIGSKESKTEKK